MKANSGYKCIWQAIKMHIFFPSLVVIWGGVLGGVFSWLHPLPWSRQPRDTRLYRRWTQTQTAYPLPSWSVSLKILPHIVTVIIVLLATVSRRWNLAGIWIQASVQTLHNLWTCLSSWFTITQLNTHIHTISIYHKTICSVTPMELYHNLHTTIKFLVIYVRLILCCHMGLDIILIIIIIL